MINAYKILVRKHEGKRPRHRYLDLKDKGCKDMD